MNSRVFGNLCGQSAGHGYATAGFTQHQRRQMIEGAAKSGAPDDYIGTNNGAVGPADGVFEDFAEHGQPVQHPSGWHGLDRRGYWQPRYRNDGIGRQAATYPVFDQRDGGTTAVLGKGARAKLRRSPGDPSRGCDARNLVEQLNRRDTAADHDNVLAGELLGRSVILGVKLPALEPVRAGIVRDVRGLPRARGVDHSTGTWETAYIPDYPGADRFKGRQLHTKDYRTAEEFAGQHVIVVGGGISAIQLLDEVSRITTTTWVTRRPPEFRPGPFTEDRGRAAVALVEDRVRRGLPPNSVVSVTGLPVTPAVEAMQARGVLNRLPMFSEILEDGVRWPDGTVLRADVIVWCTGFRSSLDHLAPLMLREPGGGITMTGRLATQVAKDPRVHLAGYGPSASTIGANRAGAAAARELMSFLGEEER